MGYGGRNWSDQTERFRKLLDKKKIPYGSISHNDPRTIDYPHFSKEVENVGLNNLNNKQWLCMDTRSFKKAVMRLNTKTVDTIRDYYINVEEFTFCYAYYNHN